MQKGEIQRVAQTRVWSFIIRVNSTEQMLNLWPLSVTKSKRNYNPKSLISRNICIIANLQSLKQQVNN